MSCGRRLIEARKRGAVRASTVIASGLGSTVQVRVRSSAPAMYLTSIVRFGCAAAASAALAPRRFRASPRGPFTRTKLCSSSWWSEVVSCASPPSASSHRILIVISDLLTHCKTLPLTIGGKPGTAGQRVLLTATAMSLGELNCMRILYAEVALTSSSVRGACRPAVAAPGAAAAAPAGGMRQAPCFFVGRRRALWVCKRSAEETRDAHVTSKHARLSVTALTRELNFSKF